MENPWKRLRIVNLVSMVTSGVCGLAIWLMLGNQLPPQIPLFYSRPWGDLQLGEPWQILILPGMAVIIGLSCAGIMAKVSKEPPLQAMILVVSIVSQVILILGMLRIVFIVL